MGLHGWSLVCLTAPWAAVPVHPWPLLRVPGKAEAQGEAEISTSRTGDRVKACQIMCPTKAFPKAKALVNNIVISITKAFDIFML